jgi:hypothetical protein
VLSDNTTVSRGVSAVFTDMLEPSLPITNPSTVACWDPAFAASWAIAGTPSDATITKDIAKPLVVLSRFCMFMNYSLFYNSLVDRSAASGNPLCRDRPPLLEKQQ